MKVKDTTLKGKSLYICYFGLREPLVQTQVLPYIRQLCEGGVKLSLLTFETNPEENWTADEINSEKQRLSEEGIDWHFLTYHKRPTVPATIFDVFNGAFFVWKYIRREKSRYNPFADSRSGDDGRNRQKVFAQETEIAF